MKVTIEINTTGPAFGPGRRGRMTEDQKAAVEVAWVLRTAAAAMERRGLITPGPLCDSAEALCGQISLSRY